MVHVVFVFNLVTFCLGSCGKSRCTWCFGDWDFIRCWRENVIHDKISSDYLVPAASCFMALWSDTFKDNVEEMAHPVGHLAEVHISVFSMAKATGTC